mmetsp:Transcript_20838/g.70594  ORF Transcript_20838/g.70594 Transcript_20838/m.70594 type:complete len:203 (-) Transcript_20838:19-627(-)
MTNSSRRTVHWSMGRLSSMSTLPSLPMKTKCSKSQTVAARRLRRHCVFKNSRQPSKPALPGAGNALEQQRVLRTCMGSKGRRQCITTSLCAHALPNGPPQSSSKPPPSCGDGIHFGAKAFAAAESVPKTASLIRREAAHELAPDRIPCAQHRSGRRSGSDAPSSQRVSASSRAALPSAAVRAAASLRSMPSAASFRRAAFLP